MISTAINPVMSTHQPGNPIVNQKSRQDSKSPSRWDLKSMSVASPLEVGGCVVVVVVGGDHTKATYLLATICSADDNTRHCALPVCLTHLSDSPEHRLTSCTSFSRRGCWLPMDWISQTTILWEKCVDGAIHLVWPCQEKHWLAGWCLFCTAHINNHYLSHVNYKLMIPQLIFFPIL